jgi:hypothetical protein
VSGGWIENSSSFNNIINPLGKGVFQNFSRNQQYIRVLNAQHKGSLETETFPAVGQCH